MDAVADRSDTGSSFATALFAGCVVALIFMVAPVIGAILLVGLLIWKAPMIAFLFGRGAASVKASYQAGQLTKEHDILVDGLRRLADADASAEPKTSTGEKPKDAWLRSL